MNNYFFTPDKIEVIPEKTLSPLYTPLRYLGYTIAIVSTYLLIYIFIFNKPINYDMTTNFAIFVFMFLFIIRPTGRRPFKLKNELKFILKNIFLFLLSIFLLTLLAYIILICHHTDISFDETIFKASLHLTMIWLFLPFLFTYILNRFCIDLPYKFFLKMHTFTLKGIDLFSSTKQVTRHHIKDEIYIDIIQQTDLPHEKADRKEYLKIQNMYLRLIKFWYAQRNYTFKLRYYFPIFISIISLIYFFYLLGFIHSSQGSSTSPIKGIQTMGLISISLTVLYFTMSHHINSFLHSEFYTSSILKELNKVYFDKHNHKQQLKFFLDKNFLVYIHDKHHDNHFCVNESKDFQNFISNKKADEEGRNLIIMVYISFFMILFIETSTGDLLGSEDNKSSTISISISTSEKGK